MGRKFFWEDYKTGDEIDHAILYGPEPYNVAAVVTLDYGEPDFQEGCWRVMSSEYYSLNLEEENMSLPIEDIKKRVIINLGNEIKQRKMELDIDMSNVLDMLLNEKRKGTR